MTTPWRSVQDAGKANETGLKPTFSETALSSY